MTKRAGMMVIVAILAGWTAVEWLDVAVFGQSIRTERVDVTVPLTYSQDQRVSVGSEQMTTAVLQQSLRRLMETTTSKTVVLHAARGLSVGEIVDLMDLLRAAGAEQVALTAN